MIHFVVKCRLQRFLFWTCFLPTLKKFSPLGLFLPFAQSGRALVFAALIALVFGHWLSIGSTLHFAPAHLPRQHVMRSRFAQNNCTWTVQTMFTADEKDSSYTRNLSPVGRGTTSIQTKEDYPSHIPVVKTKTEEPQQVRLNVQTRLCRLKLRNCFSDWG